VTASQRRTVIVLVAALGVAFLMVWAAASGPGRAVIGGYVEPDTGQVEDVTDETPDAPEKTRAPERDVVSPRANDVGTWLQDVVGFLLVLATIAIAGLGVRQALVVIGRRISEERLVVPLVPPPPNLDVARAAVDREQQRQREALAGSDVRSGIIACWVVFEDAAAEADVARAPAETASAFVVRFLHALDVDPRPVGQLAGLFLEARFSSHPLPADARPRAQQALAEIHRELGRARVPGALS
jgi:hypothetical protein